MNVIEQAKKIEGWMGDDELTWLADMAKQMETIVEIGSWKGRSTYVLCSNCPGHVYAVDPFNGGLALASLVEGSTYEDFERNVGHFKNLTTLKMVSKEAAKSNLIPSVVDMVFIDGDHEYDSVMLDLKLWAPRTKKLLCGHDYYPVRFPGVVKAVEEFLAEYGYSQGGPRSIWYHNKNGTQQGGHKCQSV